MVKSTYSSQFLPQDRVADFAKMNPQEQLVETLEAAADAECIELRRKLIELRKEEKENETELAKIRNHLTELEKINAVLEERVGRIKEREQHLRIVEICERKKPWILYDMAKDDFNLVKKDRIKCEKELEILESALEPLRSKVSSVKEELDRIEVEREESVSLKRLDGQIQTVRDTENACRTVLSKLMVELNSVQKRKLQSEKRIKELRLEITELETNIRAGHPQPPGDFQQQYAENDEQLLNIEENLESVRSQQSAIRRSSDEANKRINSVNMQITSLDDSKRQRLELIRQKSPDTYEAVNWLKSNSSKFKTKIYGPVCLEVGLTDMNYAQEVENFFNMDVMFSFVVTDRADSILFKKILCDENNLKINVIEIGELLPQNFPPQMSNDELKSFGFDHFAIEVIDAPASVLAVLCQDLKLHLIPIAKGLVDDDKVQRTQIRRYAANGISALKKVSRNDPNDWVILTNPLKQSSMFSKNVNLEEKERLSSEIQSLREVLHINMEKVKSLLTKQEKLEAERMKFNSIKRKLDDEKKEYQRQVSDFERCVQTLEIRGQELQGFLESDSYVERESQLNEKIKKNQIKLKEALCSLGNRLTQRKEQLFEQVENSLAGIEIAERLNSFMRELEEKESLLDDQREQVQMRKMKCNELKHKAKRLLEIAKQDNVDDIKDQFPEYPDDLQELEDLIVMEKTRAESKYGDDTGTLKEYERRKEEIDVTTLKKLKIEEQMQIERDQIEKLKAVWVPKVESLIGKISERFSEFFKKISNVGEIELGKEDEDFDKWSLRILVQFRDDDTLHALSATRQSGGEKSVSTILYLMSLQELSKAPFRVVDEINQGMDPRNERLIHDLAVEAASQKNCSQYFLITPKLLTGLNFNEHIKILCIYNGAWDQEVALLR